MIGMILIARVFKGSSVNPYMLYACTVSHRMFNIPKYREAFSNPFSYVSAHVIFAMQMTKIVTIAIFILYPPFIIDYIMFLFVCQYYQNFLLSFVSPHK